MTDAVALCCVIPNPLQHINYNARPPVPPVKLDNQELQLVVLTGGDHSTDQLHQPPPQSVLLYGQVSLSVRNIIKKVRPQASLPSSTHSAGEHFLHWAPFIILIYINIISCFVL